MGRPRIHADAAARQKAYREAGKVLCFRTDPDTAATIARLGERSDAKPAEVLESLVKWALLNRAWMTLGIIRYRNKKDLQP